MYFEENEMGNKEFTYSGPTKSRDKYYLTQPLYMLLCFDLLCCLLETMSLACLADRCTNQLSPSSTSISLVWYRYPGMKACGPRGT